MQTTFEVDATWGTKVLDALIQVYNHLQFKWMVFATFHNSPQLGYSFCTSHGSKRQQKLHVMIYRDFFRIYSEKLLHKILRSWFMIDCWKMIGPSGKINDCHNCCETVIFIRSMQPATDLYQTDIFWVNQFLTGRWLSRWAMLSCTAPKANNPALRCHISYRDEAIPSLTVTAQVARNYCWFHWLISHHLKGILQVVR